jgi:hypothetical protein
VAARAQREDGGPALVRRSWGSGSRWRGRSSTSAKTPWSPVNRFFPGLLLEAFVAGGTSEVSASRGFLTVSVYVLIAATIAAPTFAWRDVTG